MSHAVIIVQMSILPPPDSQVASDDQGSMTAEIRYTPPHNATPAQIGNMVERIVRRLPKLAMPEPAE